MPKNGKKLKGSETNVSFNNRRFGKVPDNTECQNCGATLVGEFCHQCGQAAKEPRRLVIGLVQDVFVDTLAIDGKLARSIGLLLLQPGVLARRFLDGRRVHYSPPFRLYLFASVFFFFAAFMVIDLPKAVINGDETLDPADIEQAQQGIAEARQEAEAAIERERQTVNSDSLEIPDDRTADPSAAEIAAAELDRAAQALEEGAANDETPSLRDTEWDDTNYNGPDWLRPHIQRLYEAGQRVTDDPRLFFSEARQNVPRFLLLAPVIYGLTLTLLYFYRRKIFIYDHFIVSLYMHAALYSYLLLSLLFSQIPIVGGFLLFIPLAWGAIQPLFVLRQAYGSSWLSVYGKSIIASVIYVIAFALIITLGLSFSLYQS